MQGRYIGENIRLLYDVLLHTQTENIPGLLLLVDFEKAFDSVAWKFMYKALDMFNFGQDIKRWIETFYKDINTCVSINGHYSEWFQIKRGARQGDPLSPYLYLICAEVLSIMIRKNDKIKGIKINNIEALLSQFADDTSLFLDGSEESLREAIQTLEKFARISGLKINKEKSQLVWIGSQKHSPTRYLRDENYCWNPGIFKVLGIKFTVEINQITRLNYEDKIDSIKNTLKKWSKRNLTPFGKITIIKTLVVSKLVYLFLNLPDPGEYFLQHLDSLLFSFLWDNKPGKISKKNVCKNYNEGGLKMLNVFFFFECIKNQLVKKDFHYRIIF